MTSVELRFQPESHEDVLTQAADEYSEIWREHGQMIVEALERRVGLPFKEPLVEVAVFEGISQSHPMKLRASYDRETKGATIVHELSHRLSSEYKIPFPENSGDVPLELHKTIYLFLYDTWVELFGQDVADRQVAVESARTPIYESAWQWALNLSESERASRLRELVQQVKPLN